MIVRIRTPQPERVPSDDVEYLDCADVALVVVLAPGHDDLWVAHLVYDHPALVVVARRRQAGHPRPFGTPDEGPKWTLLYTTMLDTPNSPYVQLVYPVRRPGRVDISTENDDSVFIQHDLAVGVGRLRHGRVPGPALRLHARGHPAVAGHLPAGDHESEVAVCGPASEVAPRNGQ